MRPDDQWLRLFAVQACQIAVLVPVLVVVVRTFCRKSSHLAYVLLALALVKCITPPVWESRLGLLGRINFAPPAAARVGSPEKEGENGAGDPIPRAGEGRRGVDDRIDTIAPPAARSVERAEIEQSGTAVGAAETAVPSEAPVATAEHSAAADVGWRGWEVLVAGCWLAGLVVFLLWLGRSLNRLRLLRANACDATSRLDGTARSIARRIGLQTVPPILVTDDASMPLVLGLFRPVVLLPRYLLETSESDELEMVLAHELNHVRRGDRWIGLLQLAAHAVWWFHPCVWWLNRELRRYREHCCDEEVLAHFDCRPQKYAQCLLSVLELKERASPELGLAGMSPFEITSRRLRNIMRSAHFDRQTPVWCWGVLLAAAIVVLPGASTTDEEASSPSTASLGAAEPNGGRTQPPERKTEHEPDEAPLATGEDASTVQAPTYRWKQGASYAYRMKIDVDLGKSIETISGTPTFIVRSLHENGAEFIVTGDRMPSFQHPKPQQLSTLDLSEIPVFPRVNLPRPRFFGDLTVQLDENGRLVSSTGEPEKLPYLLGTVYELLFPVLDDDGKSRWSKSSTTDVQFSDNDDAFYGRNAAAVSPFLSDDGEVLRAESVSEFHIDADDEDRAVVVRELRLESTAAVGGKPRVLLAGASRWVFDAEAGVPVLVEHDAELIVREGNTTVACPITAIAELSPTGRHAGEVDSPEAETGSSSYRGPHPVPSSERSVTGETDLTLNQVVQVNWHGAWYPAEVVGLGPAGAVRVHYRGWSDRWDEVVDRSRIQLADPDAIDLR